jgi:hypothetical protein|tara:strand:- start:1011 stop:1655 length:645 start_codon:yes stop_codon:yes gene_type:complete
MFFVFTFGLLLTKKMKMKHLLFLIATVSFSSCSQYVVYDSKVASNHNSKNETADKLQFFNAEKISYWYEVKEEDRDTDDGSIRVKETNTTNAISLWRNEGVLATADKDNPNILYVSPEQGNTNTLTYQKLSEFPSGVRDKFIRLYKISTKEQREGLFYLFPKEIIYERCVLDWGGREYILEMRRATYLKIISSKILKQKKNQRKLKGNFIKNQN